MSGYCRPLLTINGSLGGLAIGSFREGINLLEKRLGVLVRCSHGLAVGDVFQWLTGQVLYVGKCSDM